MKNRWEYRKNTWWRIPAGWLAGWLISWWEWIKRVANNPRAAEVPGHQNSPILPPAKHINTAFLFLESLLFVFSIYPSLLTLCHLVLNFFDPQPLHFQYIFTCLAVDSLGVKHCSACHRQLRFVLFYDGAKSTNRKARLKRKRGAQSTNSSKTTSWMQSRSGAKLVLFLHVTLRLWKHQD